MLLQFADLRAFAEQVATRLRIAAEAGAESGSRQRAFVATHLLLGVLPFGLLPVLLALGRAPSALDLTAFALSVAPILIAIQLSRSGDLDRACGLSAIAFASFATCVGAAQGGLASAAAAWLALPLIEAALSGSRRAVGIAAAAGVAALAALALVSAAGDAPAPDASALTVAGVLVASAYGVALAVRAALALGAAEHAQRERDALADLFAGSVADLVTRHGPSGAVSFASPAARALLGVEPRELLDGGLLARIHIADRPAFLQALSAAKDSLGPRAVELRLRRDSPKGRPDAPSFVWTEMRPLPASASQGAALVAVFRDVSERKAHEEALIAARDEAEQANLAKTRFLAHMSHELRTPLNAIIGFSEILSDDELCRLAPERRADYAALIHRSGAHLLEVVNSILDMARIESGAFAILPEPCEVAPIVRHCVSLMALKAQAAGVRLAVHVDPDAGEIHADRRALTQILINLLANAIKFTPRDGEVWVEARSRANGLALSVRDTGVGIAPEHIGRLGEAFFQADAGYARRHEGAGIGLSVVRGLVGLHNGEMQVESTLGRGTRVTILLPAESGSRAAVLASLPRPAAAGAPVAEPQDLRTRRRA